MSADAFDHVLVAGGGYWGRGETVPEAIRNARWLRPDMHVHVWTCEADAHVDGLGRGYGLGEKIDEGKLAQNMRGLRRK